MQWTYIVPLEVQLPELLFTISVCFMRGRLSTSSSCLVNILTSSVNIDGEGKHKHSILSVHSYVMDISKPYWPVQLEELKEIRIHLYKGETDNEWTFWGVSLGRNGELCNTTGQISRREHTVMLTGRCKRYRKYSLKFSVGQGQTESWSTGLCGPWKGRWCSSSKFWSYDLSVFDIGTLKQIPLGERKLKEIHAHVWDPRN